MKTNIENENKTLNEVDINKSKSFFDDKSISAKSCSSDDGNVGGLLSKSFSLLIHLNAFVKLGNNDVI
ncbi:MAG: hypothetical protein Q8S84_02360 [bacterium]|nr:hypothetical protein [bacterium]MDP3380395.1 hypothetical protein [bacterium]